nr:MAG TPA: hypothetical protein [Bacteriophage sp.]
MNHVARMLFLSRVGSVFSPARLFFIYERKK